MSSPSIYDGYDSATTPHKKYGTRSSNNHHRRRRRQKNNNAVIFGKDYDIEEGGTTEHVTDDVTTSHYSSRKQSQSQIQQQSLCQSLPNNNNSSDEEFDFALVLHPQSVYSFWAEHLDFRNEIIDDECDTGTATAAPISPKQPTSQQQQLIVYNGDDNNTTVAITTTTTPPPPPPRANTPSNNDSAIKNTHSASIILSSRRSLFERAMDRLTPPRLPHSFSNLSPRTDPSHLHRRGRCRRRRWGHQLILSPASCGGGGGGSSTRSLYSTTVLSSPSLTIGNNGTPYSSQRRRRQQQQQSLSSPPVIPSEIIPRGIAARSHGMTEFLQALHRGIILRRHAPRCHSRFVKLTSTDGGDTIRYSHVEAHEASIALKEQRVRFNKQHQQQRQRHEQDSDDDDDDVTSTTTTTPKTRWSDETPLPSSSRRRKKGADVLPNDVLATLHMEELSQKNRFTQTAEQLWKRLFYDGTVDAREIVAVHPARHDDPYGCNDVDDDDDDVAGGGGSRKKGTGSLRQSLDEYDESRTFSLVLLRRRFGGGGTARGGSKSFIVEQLSTEGEKWCRGVGKESRQFRTLDLEAATEGEYWLVFRGFLLLHRDAATGRFAAERASGFGSCYHRRVLGA
eukprot:CAMPEP_0172487378 /NCGR_PEP_ID=MMETSP1066-20121228/16461_1 /TAXON_ID=671091 /ORGANISM="Coscinodiscus wailesii, Strain CCMP2513" /LENGTH=620 /DNA_ID=CAMNT_0013253959 /DNA_START=135 /DNA_END=1993 /DNA_ORIENTATION=-